MTEKRETGRRDDATVEALARLLLLAVAVVGFLFAVQLLSASVRPLVPTISPALNRLVDGAAPALGASWLTAYVLLNGSVVAAIALSLFEADLIRSGQLFLLVAGSRLGSAGIVMLIGAFDFVNKRTEPLQESMRLGLLTFLVTHTIYLPATMLGAVVLARLRLSALDAEPITGADPGARSLLDPVTSAVVSELGAGISTAIALALFIGSLRLLDRVFAALGTDRFCDGISAAFRYRGVAFALGLLATAATTSIAFSLGVLVPIYNRGYIERKEILPFVMGASIGTLTDTLLVALVLDVPVGSLIVLLLALCALASALAFCLVYERYYAFVEGVQLRLLTSKRAFAAFVATIVAVPVGLLFVPY